MAEKNWQDDVREGAHKIWLAGLGALALAEQEGSKLFGELVQRGERYEADVKPKVKEAVSNAQSAATDVTAQAKKVAESARRVAGDLWGKTSDNLDETV